MAMLLDLNPVVICSISASQKTFKEITPDIIRHITLNMILSYRKKFSHKYGKMIVCCDSSNYWRKDFFPFYKVNRKKNREDSSLDWGLIFDTLDSIQSELREYLPYHVVSVPRCEADDIIAVLARYISTNEHTIEMGWPEPEKVLILSRDKDFKQLHDNLITQWSPFDKKFIHENNPSQFLLEQVIRGDVSDGVPNIRSNDDSFVMKIKQKPVTEKLIESIQSEGVIPSEYKSHWDRNKRMIDLSMIPSEYQELILKDYLEYKPNPKGKILQYMQEKGLRNLYDQASFF